MFHEEDALSRMAALLSAMDGLDEPETQEMIRYALSSEQQQQRRVVVSVNTIASLGIAAFDLLSGA
jgi:hypothetical protein